jgi:hypothetical protein
MIFSDQIMELIINLLLIIFFFVSTSAFYLPGLAPNVFCRKPIPESKCKVSLSKILF